MTQESHIVSMPLDLFWKGLGCWHFTRY